MNYVKIIETKTGHIWLMNASDNGIYKEQYKNKIEYQRYVTDLIVKDVIGNHSVSHLESGAPILEGEENSYISISHSKDYFAVSFSRINAVGVDTEVIQRSLIEGRDYFLNENELSKDWTNDELHVIWGAKETLFKLRQGNIENIVNSATINKVGKNEVVLKCDGETMKFGTFSFKEGILVYSL